MIRRPTAVLLVSAGLTVGWVADAGAAATGAAGLAPASAGQSGGVGLTASVKPKPKPKPQRRVKAKSPHRVNAKSPHRVKAKSRHRVKAKSQHRVKKLKVRSKPQVSTSPATATTTTSGVSGAAVLAYAQRFTGTPYVYGGNGPSTFDCSGFTSYVFAHFGYRLDRSSYDQMTQGAAVHGPLQLGDLVFWDHGGHVGIYAGNDSFISATVHRGIWTYSFEVWKQTQSYTTARRIIGESGAGTSATATRAVLRNGGPADATP